MYRTTRLCALLALYASTAPAEDLLTVYQQALISDPQLREAEATRMATLETKPQALSALLPRIDFNTSYQEDRFDGDDSFDPTGLGDNFERSFDGDADNTVWQLQLQQSVFRWDQWMTLKQADARVAQAEADYHAARQDLVLRVAERYFDVLAAQDTLESEQASLEAVERQLEQAEKRFEVGLIAITDVQEARAARDQGTAQVIASKRALATSREFLREIVGEYLEELERPGDRMQLVPPAPADEQAWVDSALDQNVRLVSARLGADVARQEIKIRRGGHYPTLDLTVSRQNSDFEDVRDITALNPGSGLLETNTSVTTRDATTDTIFLQLNIPLYSGGGTSSQVRQAVYQHRAAKEQLERVARETERAARDAYLGVLSEIARVESLRQAVASSDTALQATEAGFEVGTRTTVDVLDARRSLLAAQTAYSRSRYDYLLNVVRLKLAAGTLSREDLIEINDWLE